MKISKTAGARLKPHASRLIPALLEALSTLEPQVLNYLSLRATEQEKVTSDMHRIFIQKHRLDWTWLWIMFFFLSIQSAMDAARLSAAKSSPMMETINMVKRTSHDPCCLSIDTFLDVWVPEPSCSCLRLLMFLLWSLTILYLVCLCAQCLQHLDVSVLGELVPRLCELLKSGVGLGTKVKHTPIIHSYVDALKETSLHLPVNIFYIHPCFSFAMFVKHNNSVNCF